MSMAGNAAPAGIETTDLADATSQIGAVAFLAFVRSRQIRCRMITAVNRNGPTGRMLAGYIKSDSVVIGFAASPDTYEHEQNYTVSEINHGDPLSVACDAAFIVCPAVAAVTAGGVKFPFDLMHGHEVAAVL